MESCSSYVFDSQDGLSDFPVENGSDYQVRLYGFSFESVYSNITTCIDQLSQMWLVVLIGDEAD